MRLGFGLVLAFGVASVALARPDRNAFLNERADSVAQIIAQVKRDPAVMDRYKRHFSMTDREVVGYLSMLRASQLQKSGSYVVYSVPPNNRIKAHVEKFGVGTKVYRDIAGTPILIAKCGNPLHIGPKKAYADNTVDGPSDEETAAARGMTTTQDSGTEAPITETIMIPEEPLELRIETESQSPVIIPAAAPLFSPWLLGIIGGAVIIGGGGDNGGGVDVVPEPGPIALFLIGGVGLLARKKRKR